MSKELEQLKALVECGKNATQGKIKQNCDEPYIEETSIDILGSSCCSDGYFRHDEDCAFFTNAMNSRPALEKVLADYERMREALKNIDALVHRSMRENYGQMQFVCGSDAKLIQQVSRQALAEEQGE